MASVIYPYPDNALDTKPTQTYKLLDTTCKASFPEGFIIAKGNILEGIKARE